MTTDALHEFLQNPEIVSENIITPHSDHFFYEKEDDIKCGSSMPLKQSLNGIWKFKYSLNLWERPEDFYKEEYDVSNWDNINVPGHIEMQGYDRNMYVNVSYPWDGVEHLRPPFISKDYAPVGSYALDFNVNDNLYKDSLYISFQGVEVAFRVWVNGQYVGFSEDSFTPSDFDISGLTHEGMNRLSVEVYKRSSASWLEDQDMWRFFGIFREVYLYSTPKAHVADMFVKAGLDTDYIKGTLNIDAKVIGACNTAKVYLFSNNSNDIGDKADVKVCKVSELLYSFELNKSVKGNVFSTSADNLDIKPWSAEEPNLYELRVVLYDENGTPIEYAVTKIGFRTFEIKDIGNNNRVMLINGKRIIFKGVDRHEFSAENGRVVSYDEMLWDIKTFKRNNINAVRTSHYPDSEIWYRLCDEYGIYVICENNLETHGTWCSHDWHENGHVVPGSHKEWKNACISRVSNMFNSKKNHTSIVMWSLGNEAFSGQNFVDMHDYLHKVDDTRPVHYEGTIHQREFDHCSDVESKMYDKPEDVRKYLLNNPKKPFMLCEYMHAMGNSLGGMKLYTDLEDEFMMYQGGFIWDYLDQALWQEHNGTRRLAYGGDFGDRPCDYCFSTDGIVFADRTESPKCAEVKNLYANVHLKAFKDGFSVENRNLFIDLSRYYFEYTVNENGEEVFKQVISDIDTAPGENTHVKINLGFSLSETSDYTFMIRMCEKDKTMWADAGYMVAFSEEVLCAKENPFVKRKEDCSDRYTFIHTDSGLGAVGGTTGVRRGSEEATPDEFTVMFSRGEGGPAGIKKNNFEYITRAPKPTYFRAYTDNDKGFGLGEKSGIWHMLSLYQHGDLVRSEDCSEYILAEYEYKVPSGIAAYSATSTDADCESNKQNLISTVTYKAFPDGHIDISIKYHGHKDMPILPLFGWEIKLDKAFEHVEYFGKGPVENYKDRNNGVYTSVFTEDVADNLTPYLIPQECGNRTGVRYAKVSTDDGHGIIFAAKEGTFEFSFLPYSAYELENAYHADELPNRNYTWIRVLASQMGVGGDDSWGAPVHEEFRLNPEEGIELNFEMWFT